MLVMKHNRNTKKKTQTNTLKDNRRGRLQFGRLNAEQRKAEQRINCGIPGIPKIPGIPWILGMLGILGILGILEILGLADRWPVT